MPPAGELPPRPDVAAALPEMLRLAPRTWRYSGMVAEWREARRLRAGGDDDDTEVADGGEEVRGKEEEAEEEKDEMVE